jgi:hypothetical protein
MMVNYIRSEVRRQGFALTDLIQRSLERQVNVGKLEQLEEFKGFKEFKEFDVLRRGVEQILYRRSLTAP